MTDWLSYTSGEQRAQRRCQSQVCTFWFILINLRINTYLLDFDQAYSKFLTFIETTDIYRVDRLFGLLPVDGEHCSSGIAFPNDVILQICSRPELFSLVDLVDMRLPWKLMFIVCAITSRQRSEGLTSFQVLLSNFRYNRYCKSIYMLGSPTEHIFLSLLKIYLEPTQKQSEGLLKPALGLISRQSPRLDTVETLKLLPPLVTAQDVKAFLVDAVRGPVFDTKVVREVNKARSQQVARKLMALENHRVKITDSRM